MTIFFRSFILCFLFISFISIGSPSFAGMVPLSDGRYISNGSGSSIRPGSAAWGSNWSVSTSYAGQYSSISEYSLSGRGYAYPHQSGEDLSDLHQSVFRVAFEVDERLSYDLSGSFYGPNAYRAYAILTENGERLFAAGIQPYQSSLSFTQSGIFDIGNEYTLLIYLSRSGTGFSSPTDNWQFTMKTDVVVPVPATIFLMASGLGTLFGLQRKRRVPIS